MFFFWAAATRRAIRSIFAARNFRFMENEGGSKGCRYYPYRKFGLVEAAGFRWRKVANNPTHRIL